jgi:hypothetical protein
MVARLEADRKLQAYLAREKRKQLLKNISEFFHRFIAWGNRLSDEARARIIVVISFVTFLGFLFWPRYPTPTPTPIVQQVEMTSTPDSKPPVMRPPTTRKWGTPQAFAPTPTPQELSDSAYWKIKARSMSGGPPD